MLVGIPGSGKSTYAAKLKKSGYLVFSSDKTREQTGETDNAVLFGVIQKRIIRALKDGKNCVLDATNMNRKKRTAFLEKLSGRGVKCVCDLFVVPADVCKERNRMREDDHGVTDAVIDRMVASFQCPWYADGFDEIEVHSYAGEFDIGYTREDLMHFQQDNPHHTMTVGEHEELVYRNILESQAYTEHFPFLLVAARYHDDGKFFTKTFIDSLGNPSTEAHFYGHENVGSYLFLLRGFCLRQFDSAEEYELTDWGVLYISTLISLHMRPHTSWKQSERAERRDREKLGEELYRDLCILAEADANGK